MSNLYWLTDDQMARHRPQPVITGHRERRSRLIQAMGRGNASQALATVQRGPSLHPGAQLGDSASPDRSKRAAPCP